MNKMLHECLRTFTLSNYHADLGPHNFDPYNNNNNYKTSIAPISSKIIELSGAPSTGVGKTHSPGTMQSSSTMIRWQGNLGRISESEKVSFLSRGRKETMLFDDFTRLESYFQRVGTATEVPA